jgi:hypothetical protein
VIREEKRLPALSLITYHSSLFKRLNAVVARDRVDEPDEKP